MARAGAPIPAAWRAANKAEINWVTLGDTNAVAERLLRELSLAETTIDLGHLVNGRAIPRTLALFEPLDGYQQAEPIEDFADIAPGLVAASAWVRWAMAVRPSALRTTMPGRTIQRMGR